MATQRNTRAQAGRRQGLQTARQDPDLAAQSDSAEPDVLLDVPNLSVDEITLEVDNLHARISLEARLADLVQLHVGADARIERVALEIKGVQAQAQLKARLHNVLAIVERALDTVDQHPELLTELSRSVQTAAGEVGRSVETVGEEAGGAVEGAADAAKEPRQLAEGATERAGDKTDSGSKRARSRS
jgi:hypothetical protein